MRLPRTSEREVSAPPEKDGGVAGCVSFHISGVWMHGMPEELGAVDPWIYHAGHPRECAA